MILTRIFILIILFVIQSFCQIQSWHKKIWTEEELMSYWEEKGMTSIEGIYEGILDTKNDPNYRLAVKIDENQYKIIYLSGSKGSDSYLWSEGDIKAELTPTAMENVFKAQWYLASKFKETNTLVTFNDAMMKLVWADGSPSTTYIKIYPLYYNGVATEEIVYSSSGTGFALSEDGYIVTCNHVIENAKKVFVRGIEGNFQRRYECKPILSDYNNDLAILKIEDSTFIKIKQITYSLRMELLNPGENIFVFGYPLRATMGDEIKLTSGIISSRTGFKGDISSYQVSAPVQPGSSGGPVFDFYGNVVGVINAKHIGAENASYAIKIEYLKNLVNLLPEISIPKTKSRSKQTTLSEIAELVKGYIYIIEVK